MQGITQGTTDWNFVNDLQGRYRMINSAGARFRGRTVEDVMGKRDIDLFTEETARDTVASDRKVIEAGKNQT